MAGDGFFTGTENDQPLASSKSERKNSAGNKADPENAKNPLEGLNKDNLQTSTEHNNASANETEQEIENLESSTNEQKKNFKEKIKEMVDGIRNQKDKSKKVGLPEFLSFIKKTMKPAGGKNAPPPGSEELEKKSKNKIIAIAGVVLMVLFGIKTFFEEDASSVVTKNTKSPDAGATSLFGDYNPEIGQIKGQVVTSKEVQDKVDKATKDMMVNINKLKDENSKLRRHEIVIAQDSIGNENSRFTNANQQPNLRINENTEPQNQNNTMDPPSLPQINDPLSVSETMISPDPPMSLNPMATSRPTKKMDSPYPVVGQSPTSPQSRSEFGVSGDKVYSYSPVTDAVKGVAGAVKDSMSNPLGKASETKGVNAKDPVAIVPASTIVGGVMLSGLDAPTGNGASGDPMPIVMQLMDNGTTASYFQVPIKGCRIILAGFGDLPSERVYMRLERLICIAETGEVYSASANGVVLGEDGKNGMRGRVVDKQGALIMRSMLAGMMQGIGDVLKTLQQTTLVSAATGIASTNSLSGTALGKAAIGGGLVSSSKRLADYYLKKAEQLYPIIEINAGRDVEVLFTRDLQFFPISKIVGISPDSGTEGSTGGFWDIPVSLK